MAVCVTLATTQGPDPVVDSHGNASYSWFTVDQSTTDLSQCAYVLHTYAEEQASSLGGLGQLTSMTTDEALVIGAAVGLLWSLAWGLRQIARSIDIGSFKDESQDD